MTKNPYQKYQQLQIEQADQKELILLLYDGAIKFLRMARETIKKKDIEGTHEKLIRVRRIINELLFSLNLETGELAKNLQSLYVYMLGRVSDANLRKEIKPIKEILGILQELRSSWATLEVISQPPITYSENKGILSIRG